MNFVNNMQFKINNKSFIHRLNAYNGFLKFIFKQKNSNEEKPE